MRLLELVDGSPGNLRMIEPDDDKIPPYAVLSHTWGADGEEYLYKDVVDGTGLDKTGYSKVWFCATNASYHGLRHIWVDTCCIDKSSSTELSEAINSMFRWYKNAARCYVWLTDVSWTGSPQELEISFKQSRWFTRGWTLQELIAPYSVEFYSTAGYRIGSKEDFEQQICERTGIPITALRGAPLDTFSVDERFAWANDRETRRQEDKAYSLFGIFGVHMPLLYGEGRESAFDRLRREIDARSTPSLDSGSSTNVTSPDQERIWKPRYYFFYSWHASHDRIAHSLGLDKPPILRRAFLRGHSIASLGQWRALLRGPADGRADGIAYKVENEWQEAKLIMDEVDEYIPEPCTINILTGDGWFEAEGRAFMYCGPETGLEGVLPGASPSRNKFCSLDCTMSRQEKTAPQQQLFHTPSEGSVSLLQSG